MKLETQWLTSHTRRRALQIMGNLLAGSPLVFGQQDPFRDSPRVPGMNELVNAFDFPLYLIAGGVIAGWDLFAPPMILLNWLGQRLVNRNELAIHERGVRWANNYVLLDQIASLSSGTETSSSGTLTGTDPSGR